MRDYGKVSPMFWSGNTGREIRKRGHECQLAALYLMTAPGATMLGVYHLPAVTLAHAIGSPLEGALEALRSLSEVGFCTYDEEAEWVWVHEMACYQICQQLDPKDNRVKSVAKDWLSLPKLPFLQGFYERYCDAFLLPDRVEKVSPSKAPSKPLRSQEQEQEQEQDKRKEPIGSSPSATADEPPTRSDPIPYQKIVDLFNETMTGLPKVREVTAKRKTLIRTAWRESQQRQSVEEFWKPYFEECADDNFHNGTGPYLNGHENWRPNFDYLIRSTTITKVYEAAMDRAERS